MFCIGGSKFKNPPQHHPLPQPKKEKKKKTTAKAKAKTNKEPRKQEANSKDAFVKHMKFVYRGKC
jgi:hypothetical protein